MLEESSKRISVKDIRKRENVTIRISRCELSGYPFVEIRQYHEDGEGVPRATKKGVSFVPELLDEVIEGLVEVRKHYRRHRIDISRKTPNDTI